MKTTTIVSLAAACMAAVPVAVSAADGGDFAALRDEVRRLRETYEKRIEALERRLAEAEGTAARAQDAAATAQTAASRAETRAQAGDAARTPPVVAGGTPRNSESAFNPGISLILAGTYTNLKADPSTRPYAINGFVPSGGEVGPPPRSFSLGESELAITANIDHRFRGTMFLALPPGSDESPKVEEAHVQTLGLPGGFNLKFGRFLSGVGYLNEQHPHAWDFADAPLAYKAFFGGQTRGDGMQLKWLAPTDTFLEFGAEAGRSTSFPASDRNKNGIQTAALFMHAGDDVGIEHSWRAGLSVIGTSPRDREFSDTDSTGTTTTNKISGKSRTWIADMVWKWAPGGNPSARYLKLQGEVFHRSESGSLNSDSSAGTCGGACTDTFSSRQSGWYAQAVYKFAPAWRMGLRADRLSAGRTSIGLIDNGTLAVADLPVLAAHSPRRATAMLDWSPSEYSLVRLQFARDRSRTGDPDNQLWLQYIVSLGAHGAHKY